MVWDRLSGTYVEETETVVFGVTDRLEGTSVIATALGGYALARDLIPAPTAAAAIEIAIDRPGSHELGPIRFEPSRGARPAPRSTPRRASCPR